MKAVIMAGGEGKRLKSITGELPKPMAKLLGRPMIEHIVYLLRDAGFDDICAALKYRGELIEDFLGDGSAFGVKMSYKTEKEPLGTAGAVKNCRDFYGNDDFLVISGDAACDFDLKALYEEHLRRRADVTIALYKSSTPLSLGLTVTDSKDAVRCFIEKPDWTRVVTDTVNTGIYVISPKVMELVPEDTEYDFGRELFPLLIERGARIIGIAMNGYWCDVGTPLSYYRCCADALEGKIKLRAGEAFSEAVSGQGAVLRKEKTGGESEKNKFPKGAAALICPCKGRAEMMGRLSREFMDMGADYSHGLSLAGRRCEVRIAPLPDVSALGVYAGAEDAEFAQELAAEIKGMIERSGL